MEQRKAPVLAVFLRLACLVPIAIQGPLARVGTSAGIFRVAAPILSYFQGVALGIRFPRLTI